MRSLLFFLASVTTVLGLAVLCPGDEARQTQPVEAVKQETCPVMDGRIINRRLFVDYNGCRVYLCCRPCVVAFKKDPAKYFRKLQDQGIAMEPVGTPAVAGAGEKSGGR